MSARAVQSLASIGLTGSRAADAAVHNVARFGDGASWRVEIPSVEGPAALQAVIEEPAARQVTIHRVSQGSGVALLTDAELNETASLATAAGLELVLWAGLRSSWDISAQARTASGATGAAAVRGLPGITAGVDEALRAADAGIGIGIGIVLVADIGLLWVLGRLKREGRLPAGFVLKTSITLPVADPKTARALVDMGATTLNLPADLPIADIAAIRRAVEVPFDCYVEGADDFGAPLRYHEIRDLVIAAAPVHLKFGLRNAVGVYPAGGHVEPAVVAASRERVRRARIGIETLARSGLTS